LLGVLRLTTRGVVGRVDLTGRGPGRCGDVGEEVDEAHDRVVIVFNGGALVVGERDLDEHPLQPVFGFEQLRLTGGLGQANPRLAPDAVLSMDDDHRAAGCTIGRFE
jgi:hypothetical protein